MVIINEHFFCDFWYVDFMCPLESHRWVSTKDALSKTTKMMNTPANSYFTLYNITFTCNKHRDISFLLFSFIYSEIPLLRPPKIKTFIKNLISKV